jgi:transcriptional regulator with XRE-family HTH domain
MPSADSRTVSGMSNQLSACREAHPLRQRRRAAGLSQAELAVAADVGPATVARIERGDRANSATLAALARVLDCRPADIVLPGQSR